MKFQQLQLLQILLFGISYAVVAEDNNCVATIQNGIINGARAESLNPSKTVCMYTGIPFAAPPIGSLRFKPPQPAQAWDILNATKLPNWCPQSGTPPSGIEISEDCLFLNVYQPELTDTSTANLPVMIWFHGGSYTSGSTLPYYNHTRLLARGDVILVVVHYRLGMLGFLSTGDYVVPGNNGLKDQQLAIRWVNKNIRAFGGNPEQVTIFGESAGAGSVLYQLVSPLNKGLIHGVIAQSGAALEPFDKHPSESAKYMAARMWCPTYSSQAIVDCLRRKSWNEIIAAQSLYVTEGSLKMSHTYYTMTPVVEPNLPGAVITKEPIEIMKNGYIDTSIPVILGANKHDGSLGVAGLYVGRYWPWGLYKNPEFMRNQIVPELLAYSNIQGDYANRAVASTVEMTYLSGVNRSSWDESVPGLVDILTVFAFKSALLHTAELLSKRGSSVYLYSFEHHSENTVWDLYFGSLALSIPVDHGIAHGDELIYLFDFPANFTSQDTAFSETFCDMWINFASFGNPTPEPSDRYEQWPAYNAENELYMKLNLTPTAMVDYRTSWRPGGFEWN